MIHLKPLVTADSSKCSAVATLRASAQWLVGAVARRYERAEIAAHRIGERPLVILIAPLRRRRSRRVLEACWET